MFRLGIYKQRKEGNNRLLECFYSENEGVLKECAQHLLGLYRVYVEDLARRIKLNDTTYYHLIEKVKVANSDEVINSLDELRVSITMCVDVKKQEINIEYFRVTSLDTIKELGMLDKISLSEEDDCLYINFYSKLDQLDVALSHESRQQFLKEVILFKHLNLENEEFISCIKTLI